MGGQKQGWRTLQSPGPHSGRKARGVSLPTAERGRLRPRGGEDGFLAHTPTEGDQGKCLLHRTLPSLEVGGPSGPVSPVQRGAVPRTLGLTCCQWCQKPHT